MPCPLPSSGGYLGAASDVIDLGVPVLEAKRHLAGLDRSDIFSTQIDGPADPRRSRTMRWVPLAGSPLSRAAGGALVRFVSSSWPPPPVLAAILASGRLDVGLRKIAALEH